MSATAPGPSRHGSRASRRDERGAATVAGLVLLAVLTVVTLASVVMGRLLVDQRRVAAGADLAALAGAAAVQRGADGCAAARATASRNGVVVERCAVEGEEVRVSATLRAPELLGREVVLRAAALAGPVARREE